MRGQEYVVAMKPCGRGLLLETLRYADEIHKSSGFFRDIGDTKPDPDLLDMASMLIERKAGEFDPNEFHNRYVDALHRLIEEKQKQKGEKIIEDPDADAGPPKGSNVIDLMAALKKSLGDEKRGKQDKPKKSSAKKSTSKKEPAKAPARKRANHAPARAARHRDLQQEARLLEDEGAARAQAQGQGRQLRRPEARGLAAALGFPAGARRSAQELGGAQGTQPRSLARTGWRCGPRTIRSTIGDFEGTIPRGEYGGGTVMLWDQGRWVPEPSKDPSKTIEEGHLHFTLEGERMKGEWVMFRLKPRPGEKAEPWMLKKVTDDFADPGDGDALVDNCVTSVTTGRTMAEIAVGEDVWRSNRDSQRGGRAKREPTKPRRRSRSRS